MRAFAALSGVFLGAILLVSGYGMAFLHDDIGYEAPLYLAVVGAVGLPLAYVLKASRKLPRPVSRILFVAMIIGAGILWAPPWSDAALWADHWQPLTIFTAIWVIAALPLLRAGIRHRP